MIKATIAAAVAIVGALVIWAPGASSAGTSKPSTYEPHLNPKNFSVVIDNPYFPLPVGRTWVYRGTKDGQSQIDRVTVTTKTKRVAEGITARVVSDVATHQGKLLEKTSDWYAQDNRGNAWYVGEDTTAYLPTGKTDNSGSWQARVH